MWSICRVQSRVGTHRSGDTSSKEKLSGTTQPGTHRHGIAKKYARCGASTCSGRCILWRDECSSTAHSPISPSPRPLTLHYICMAKTPDIVSGGRIKDLKNREEDKRTRAHAPLIRTFSSSKRIEDKSTLCHICSCHFRRLRLVDNVMHRVPLYSDCTRTSLPNTVSFWASDCKSEQS
jgi:hypothetical protein